MINLWYDESYWAHRNGIVSGPEKVVKNLIKSLDQESVPYAVNCDRYEYNFLLQYNALGHSKHENLEHESCVIGPQYWGWDAYGKFLFENPQYYKQLVTPSDWVTNQLINQFNVPKNKVSSWPVGIELFDSEKEVKKDCLIYYKRRNEQELKLVIDFLESRGLSYEIFGYGNYSQDQFIDTCNKVKFCFLLNGTESQGIAVQEIMSTNTPILAWDVTIWNDMGEEYSTPATSIPYWDNQCGEVFYEYSDLDMTFDKFYDRLEKYTPRKFVEENLSFKKSLELLLNIVVN
jgi:hypothetical protein